MQNRIRFRAVKPLPVFQTQRLIQISSICQAQPSENEHEIAQKQTEEQKPVQVGASATCKPMSILSDEVALPEGVEIKPRQERVQRVENAQALCLGPALAERMANMGVARLTQFQELVLPLLYGRKSVFAIGPTGQGKTLAGVIFCAAVARDGGHSTVLVHSAQMLRQLIQYCRMLVPDDWCSPEDYSPSKHVFVSLLSKAHLFKTAAKRCEVLLVDECDQMSDCGFEQQLKDALARTSAAQRVFLSATSGQKVVQLLKGHFETQLFVNGTFPLSENVTLVMKLYQAQQHLQTISDEIAAISHLQNAVVFTNSDAEALTLAQSISEDQEATPGKMKKNICVLSKANAEAHESIIKEFNSSKNNAVFASSAYGRGVDFFNSDVVILAFQPHSAEDFIHKCGRTGRGFRAGTAVWMIAVECESPHFLEQSSFSIGEFQHIRVPGVRAIQQIATRVRLPHVPVLIQRALEVLELDQRLGLESRQVLMSDIGKRDGQVVELKPLVPYFAEALDNYTLAPGAAGRSQSADMLFEEYLPAPLQRCIQKLVKLQLGDAARPPFFDFKLVDKDKRFRFTAALVDELRTQCNVFMQEIPGGLRLHGRAADVFAGYQLLRQQVAHLQ